MKFEELFSHTFRALRERIDEAAIQRQVDFMLPSMPMVEACRADEFDFFLPWIELGRLSVDQMHHAAERYFLGKTKSGASIFWMIDDMHRPLDAMIDPDIWMSRLLKKRETILRAWRPGQCLFGLHLLCHTALELCSLATEGTQESTESTERISHTDLKDLTDSKSPAEMTEMTERISHTENTESTEKNSHTDLKDLNHESIRGLNYSNSCLGKRAKLESSNSFPVSIVEAPGAAVILSEVYPNSIWLSTVPNACFTIDLLEPLRGRTIKVYPHTDATLSNYLAWLDLADMARQTYHLDITVSHTLEDAASPSQKDREIDILQYLYELYSFNRKVP